MKGPDKIYVKITHPISDEYTEMIDFEHGKGIEYIRKDLVDSMLQMSLYPSKKDIQKELLIKKACEWLNMFYNEETCSYLIDEDIKNFETYMKGE